MLEEEDTCNTLLSQKLEASLRRISFLEIENEQLKREVHRLSTQNALLRGQDSDRRPTFLLKKTQSLACNVASSPEKQMDQNNNTDENSFVGDNSTARTRSPRVPKPPPTPSSFSSSSSHSSNVIKGMKPPPPPPPPVSWRSGCVAIKAVRRVPEVLELYRSLTKKEGRSDMKAGSLGTPSPTNSREMIGEIENRSAYVLAIKSDVETQAEFINFLTREVENAAYKDIADVEAFVKWLDEELSYLVDERAVLKHFPRWPEQKADAMREAAVGYRELKNLETEALAFHDDRRQPTAVALKRIQALQDKLERGVQSTERARESTGKRFRDFKVPWQWMLDSGIIAQLKSGSMKLAKEYMNRVVTSVKFDAFSDEEELMEQGVRFAYRVHQFIGGFDEECHQAFQEMKKLACD
ncbi:protein CHUP1, chloroplastic-like [Zingiber officinale]|uniref:protein CHUP1, chloroplastic-like n=1 Tax=Zingiber officinale TaxID=94328 RepID=UPI001C4B6EED|nr:protein CHUP1, chloroplastic-like [Zingiber officinale]